MSDIERIDRRLSTVERAVVDGDPEVPALDDLASLAADLETVRERVDAHERRLADLEGRIDALEGAVGGVESADDAVERRANAAVAAVDRLEYRIDALERAIDGSRDRDEAGSGSAPGDEREIEPEEAVRAADGREDRRRYESSAGLTDPAQSTGDRPSVERTVEGIVSTADDGVRSGGDPDDRSVPTTVTDAPFRSEATATQRTIECRLSDRSDRRSSAERDGSVGDRSSDPDPDAADPTDSTADGPADDRCSSDGSPSAIETSGEAAQGATDGTTGFLGSIRARLP